MRSQAVNNRVPYPPETQPQLPHILKVENLRELFERPHGHVLFALDRAEAESLLFSC